MPIEIKIDQSTLPKDGQKVKWQTQQDFDNGVWKNGEYSDDDGYGLFLYNMQSGGTTSDWDIMWKVLHWDLIEDTG